VLLLWGVVPGPAFCRLTLTDGIVHLIYGLISYLYRADEAERLRGELDTHKRISFDHTRAADEASKVARMELHQLRSQVASLEVERQSLASAKLDLVHETNRQKKRVRNLSVCSFAGASTVIGSFEGYAESVEKCSWLHLIHSQYEFLVWFGTMLPNATSKSADIHACPPPSLRACSLSFSRPLPSGVTANQQAEERDEQVRRLTRLLENKDQTIAEIGPRFKESRRATAQSTSNLSKSMGRSGWKA
jgi:hypothetical protein